MSASQLKSTEKKILDSSGYESDIENNTPRREDSSLFCGPPRNRRRRDRTQFSASDLTKLEEHFLIDRYPDINARERLADELAVSEDRIQVWFQNRRSKLRRRAANRPPPLDLPKHILSTHARPTMRAQQLAHTSPMFTPGQLATLTDWELSLMNSYPSYTNMTPVPSVAHPSPISVRVNIANQVNIPDKPSPDANDEQNTNESKPVTFKRPWETPSPSEQRNRRRVSSDTVSPTEKPPATPDLLCHTPGIPSTPSPGFLTFMQPFIPYNTLGHPATGYMFFNSQTPSLMDSFM